MLPGHCSTYGIRCVISTSFADIFYNNSFKNGLLPIVVTPEELELLLDDAARGANATLTVDLVTQEIHGPDGGVIKFEIDEFKKHCLLNGPRRDRPDDGKRPSHRQARGPHHQSPALALGAIGSNGKKQARARRHRRGTPCVN